MEAMIMNPVLIPSSEVQSSVLPLIVCMAQQVESMTFASIEALVAVNTRLAHDVLRQVPQVNATQAQVHFEIEDALAHASLSVREVRKAVAILKINEDLQRLANRATTVAATVLRMAEKGDTVLPELQPLAIAVSQVVRKTLQSLIRHDPVLANNVGASTELVDGYRYYAFQSLQNGLLQRSDAASILLASHQLEQIGDCAGNIAEGLVLWLECDKTRCHAA
jgi:phosphate transport system protein